VWIGVKSLLTDVVSGATATTPRKGTTTVKPIIALLSALAIVLLAIAFLLYGPAFATQLQSCQTSLYTTDQFQCLTSGSREATNGFILYLAGVVAALLAWGIALIRTVQLQRWFWFIVVFLLSPLGSLLFGVAGPTTRARQGTRVAGG
jgi:hypothetical protein